MQIMRQSARSFAARPTSRWAPAVRPMAASARSFSTFKYLESHEYVRVEDNKAVIGISDFAQTQLGDVVYVDLPSVGDTFDKGDSFGSVESVKAASDVYAPVSGKVLEVNESVVENPELVNTDAMSDGWFIKMEMTDKSELDSLLDEDAYKKLCEE